LHRSRTVRQGQVFSRSLVLCCAMLCACAAHAVVASEKGVVVGRLTFTEDGDDIDCRRMGVGGKAIPPNISKVRNLSPRTPSCDCYRPLQEAAPVAPRLRLVASGRVCTCVGSVRAEAVCVCRVLLPTYVLHVCLLR
jgi:hypothetical protein